MSKTSDERPKINAEKFMSIVAESQWAQRRYNQELSDLIIFGTSAPYIYKKPTLWQRIKWPIQGFFRRARDAWLVLIGRAYIHEDD